MDFETLHMIVLPFEALFFRDSPHGDGCSDEYHIHHQQKLDPDRIDPLADMHYQKLEITAADP